MTKKYWLLKSEPSTWSWDDQVKSNIDMWDGVKNYQARNNLMKMKKGDHCFFYHSVHEKSIVGIVEVCQLARQDPTTDDERWECVDIKAIKEMRVKITLDDIKSNDKLSEMVLVKNSRLSVQPVLPAEWNEILSMASTTL